MKIKTEILQKMVAKAIQGASFNKNIPLSSLIGIEYKDDNLILTTTDGSNQFKVSSTEVQLGITEKQPNFYTIVNAEIFSKLVGKTTKEFIELKNNENYLELTGNGAYKLEIAINEEGEMVRFPEIQSNYIEISKIKLNDLQNAIKVAKASVAKTTEIPCITGYYISKTTITTDRQLVCRLDNELLTEPILVSNEMAELLLLVDNSEEIELSKKDNNLLFTTNEYTIVGKELEGKELYPVQPIEKLTQLTYDNQVKVNKQELLNILDRMILFVTDYDKNGIYLDFSTEGITIQSQKSNAIETIEPLEVAERKQFHCLVNIEMLKAQVEVVSVDSVEIYYGQEKSIKIVDGNATYVISLLDKAK